MSHALTLIARPLEPALVSAVKKRIAPAVRGRVEERWLGNGEACDLLCMPEDERTLKTNVAMPLDGKPVDWALLPLEGRRKRLLISDMDSTMIGQECIDELAKEAGVGSEVVKITERAMRGEIDFVEALERRVALLKGLHEMVLEKVFQEKIRPMPGARTLVQTMKKHGAYTLLVSGGFTFFTNRVRDMLGFGEDHANTLEIHDRRLTGKVVPPILDKQAKRDSLVSKAKELWLSLDETLAVGNGANDLPMIKESGLGVAYHGKEIVRKSADVAINYSDLTALLYLQGYRKEEFFA